MMGEGYYLQCGACDGEVFVSEAQWNDATVHVVPHVGCAYVTWVNNKPVAGGVDLDHARRHAD